MNQVRSNRTSASIQNTETSAQATPAPPTTTRRQDPLATLERELLARPGSHHHPHHYRHPTGAQLAGHIALPTLSSPSAVNRSRTPSPAPTAGARRCMAATAAWIPLTEENIAHSSVFPGPIERRQSWDGQEYRHAMMVQATGLVCGCHPNGHGGHAHEHDSHSKHHGINVPPQNSYEADRGFSEASH